MVRSIALAAALSFACGCATTSPKTAAPRPQPAEKRANPGPAPGRKGYQHPAEPERRALFASLVETIRRYHVFSAQTDLNLGRRWQDDLPAVEAAFAAAGSRDKLLDAIEQLVGSLHDPHCYFNAPSRPRHLLLGIEAAAEWRDGSPGFFVLSVEDASLRGKLSPGERVVSVDGLPASGLIERFRLHARMNHPRTVAHQVARILVRRSTTMGVAEGDKSVWIVAPRAGGEPRSVELTWRSQPAKDDSEHAIDYREELCGDLAPRGYGAYRLVAQGNNWCGYLSALPPYSAYPIVRQFSFGYFGGPQTVRADQFALRRFLGEQEDARGVLLDLRENHGGTNPNWMMDWWAPGPYTDHFVELRLQPDFDNERRLSEAMLTGGRARRYLEQLASRQPGQEFTSPLPFFCKPDTCDWENRYVPAHQVTRLPVALLVGPECVSSCDSFSMLFAENGFGPLVGEQTAAGFTSFRMRVPVRTAVGEELGFFWLAFSRDRSGRTGELLEAVPLHLDRQVERTAENFERHDAMLVEQAIEALESRSPAPASGSAVPPRR